MKAFTLLTIFCIGVQPCALGAESETPTLHGGTQMHASARVDLTKDSSDEQWDFRILDKIDKSPDFGSAAPPGKGLVNRSKKNMRSLMNFMFDTRGTDWSKEGADVAIGKDSDLTSDTTGYYHDQLQRDELHWRVASLIARIASALGDDRNSGKTEIFQLKKLVGESETEAVVEWLTDANRDEERQRIPKAVSFDLSEILDAQDAMLSAALDKDQVIASIKKDLRPYTNSKRYRRMATKFAYSTLGIAAFMPNWVAPVAETSFLATMMANGGPEQDKLLKEIYYAKRLEKRHDLIQKELNLALNSRELSIASGNAPLYRFSREFTEYLCGNRFERKLFPETKSAIAKRSTETDRAAATSAETGAATDTDTDTASISNDDTESAAARIMEHL